MIKITDWVAVIPEEDKRIAYVGENEAVTREFLLTGSDAITYADWSFHLDMAFDLSTVTDVNTHRSETTKETQSESISEVATSLTATTTRESRDVTNVTVDCAYPTDVAMLSKRRLPEGLVLTWQVLRQQTQLPGMLRATLRAVSSEGRVKKSAMMVFHVDAAVEAAPAATIPLSEFEAMEQRMSGLVDNAEATVAAMEVLVPQLQQDVDTVERLAPQMKADAAAAAAAAEKAETKVESLIERNNKQPVSLWVGTLAEYSAITDKDENRLYLISDDGGLEGATNLVANTTDLNGVGLAFGANCPCTDSERIAALLRHKMAVVRVAGQTVLCSVQTAATSNTLTADDIVMITGCASSSYSNPVSISGSYTMHPLELVVVDIRIVFDTDRPAQATAANIYNYSRRQGLGSDTVEGVNVWRIDLLNATQY